MRVVRILALAAAAGALSTAAAAGALSTAATAAGQSGHMSVYAPANRCFAQRY